MITSNIEHCTTVLREFLIDILMIICHISVHKLSDCNAFGIRASIGIQYLWNNNSNNKHIGKVKDFSA